MATRTHIVLPEDVLEEVDQIAGKRKRSQYIENAVREKLARDQRSKLIAEMAGILADEDIPGWGTPEQASEWVRELRRLDLERLEQSLARWDV